MTKRMLIDAAHPEEIRVVVLDGNRLEEFDYESSSRKTLKGNIYLGKITRVEPSLQAAFVEYGGNRHGFLPFNDIHPDYYRIPIADREALIAQEAAFAADEPPDTDQQASDTDEEYDQEQSAAPDSSSETGAPDDEDAIETVGGDEVEPVRVQQRSRRSYKIQEVIKRRQIVLVQVTKEERGNKGAALTTYISLAGRYCVLMPNAIRGGGISRKITNLKDRRRLKDVIDSLDLPAGMAVILRTAGMERSKAEIRRDYEFLTRVWDEIREKTFNSRAPALIYEEANLIKRTIRDIYSRDIEEVLVEGDEAYRTAKTFMRALMPSHARRVQLYKDPGVHLFPSLQVESQLDALHSSTVRLKSGGYIVINLTEALVAIDVNSGRATRERHIEETALRTNLEAASEIARQLRLRDLAGLIVIDFIDMEDRRNNAAVERRLKEAMRLDRARVQIGRISQLGLLELSRQRLRPSLLETSMQMCPHCDGRGLIRTVHSTALHVFRAIEEEAVRRRSAEVAVFAPTEVALFLLNSKREALVEMERRQGLRVAFERDDTLVSPAYRIEQRRAMPKEEELRPVDEDEAVPTAPLAGDVEYDADVPDEEEQEAEEASAELRPSSPAGEEDRPRRRRRGRRGGRRRGRRDETLETHGDSLEEPSYAEGDGSAAPDTDGEEEPEWAASGDGEDHASQSAPLHRGIAEQAGERSLEDEGSVPWYESPSVGDASAEPQVLTSELPQPDLIDPDLPAPSLAIGESNSGEPERPDALHDLESRQAMWIGSGQPTNEPEDQVEVADERLSRFDSHTEPESAPPSPAESGNGEITSSGPASEQESVMVREPRERRRGWWNRLTE